MKKLLPILAFALLLTACGKTTVRLTVNFDTRDPARIVELRAAIPRVVEGRLLSKQKTVVSQKIDIENGKMVLIVQASDAEAAKIVQDGLTAPFSMSIMKQVGAGLGDIISEKYGEFKETGITTKHFDWILSDGTKTDAGISKGAVVIDFTDEGKKLLKDVFKRNQGETIGIFVREQLMSKKLVTAKDTQDSIAIDNIPSAELAAAFADDVNVSLHTTFTAAP